MFKKTVLATTVAMFCSSLAFADQALPTKSEQLSEITVTGQSNQQPTTITRQQIEQSQANDIKGIFANELDVGVSATQGTRSGNRGVNVRGLTGNRVAMTVDGIPLPEAQEASHFISYGMEFGRGDYVETTALRGATVQYGGSANSLSGDVNFATLEPGDLLKGRQAGGFVGSGYNSSDTSTYGTVGGAVELDRYQGMVVSTVRGGHQTKTHGDNAGVGDTRTEADPANYGSIYTLTKHQFQVNDNNSIKFTYEHLHKRTDTDLLSKTGTSIDSGTGIQVNGQAIDRVSRDRFSLQHEYSNQAGWLQNAQTQLYYQDSETENERLRQSATNYRHEHSNVRTKVYGLKADLRSDLDGAVPQSLRYGFHLNRTDANNGLRYERPAYTRGMLARVGRAVFDGKPSSDTRQTRFDLYVEDQISLGNIVITPNLGFVHYRITPKADSNVITGYEAKKSSQTLFTPKIALNWKLAQEFEPYFQYSRGVRTPSAQELSSFFYESVFGNNVGVVGNPNLKAETAHNFEVGFKGGSPRLQYQVAGFYNQYKNFIGWKDITQEMTGYAQFVQYQNYDKAKIYGVTAQAKWKFYEDFFVNLGLAYARGKATDEGVKTPINSVQPLKTRIGLGYEIERFGANLQWTYVRGKADKDIYAPATTRGATVISSFYNPTSGGVSLFDFGMYWKPVKNVTFNANINNLFNKKYWNWHDISYLAMLRGDSANGNPAIGITSSNADRYSAPGRHLNVGVRYEF